MKIHAGKDEPRHDERHPGQGGDDGGPARAATGEHEQADGERVNDGVVARHRGQADEEVDEHLALARERLIAGRAEHHREGGYLG